MIEVIVFTSNGRSFIFKNVKNLYPTTNGFEFDYLGISTGVNRHVCFNYNSVCGYAIKSEDK